MSIELVKKVILVADVPTEATGRIYPRAELLKECDRLKDKELLGTFGGICTGDEFDNSKSIIKCKNIRMEGNALVCDFTILDTVYGLQLQSMIQNHQFVLTPRGIGTTCSDNAAIITNYTLLGIDVKLC